MAPSHLAGLQPVHVGLLRPRHVRPGERLICSRVSTASFWTTALSESCGLCCRSMIRMRVCGWWVNTYEMSSDSCGGASDLCCTWSVVCRSVTVSPQSCACVPAWTRTWQVGSHVAVAPLLSVHSINSRSCVKCYWVQLPVTFHVCFPHFPSMHGVLKSCQRHRAVLQRQHSQQKHFWPACLCSAGLSAETLPWRRVADLHVMISCGFIAMLGWSIDREQLAEIFHQEEGR